MSGAHHVDQDRKPGELRASLSAMVAGVVARQVEQRAAGWCEAIAFVRPFADDLADDLRHEGRRRWGAGFDELDFPAAETLDHRLQRVEGYKAAVRFLGVFAAEFADELEAEGRKRWGEHYDRRGAAR